ncbi:MAG: helix-hairpin-helix domain-containing protein [Sediminibacterium sp.]|jgi:DNA polymerase (family X)
MDNYEIADNFSLLGKLMDIHGDNSFKAKSYTSAAFTIEKLPMQLAEMPPEKINSINGIGEAIGKRIIEQLQTGTLALLQEYLQKTPEGILTMLSIKGIGPKKIATIWKELEIETIGELLYACSENRLTLYKGFGAKSQQNIKEAIEFYMGSQGSFLYQQIESYATQLTTSLQNIFPNFLFSITGNFKQQAEVISQLSWVTTTPKNEIMAFLGSQSFVFENIFENIFSCKGPEQIELIFHISSPELFISTLFETSSSEEFLQEWKTLTNWNNQKEYQSEEDIFESFGFAFIPAYQRETKEILTLAKNATLKPCIQTSDIKGIIHSHSNWSDGATTIEAMAKAAIEKGLEYLVISDHSQSAFYANGLKEARIFAQQQQIDALNKQLAPFRIFKSIESDILNDGSLDYSDEVLSSFDLVIASVHSNLKMTEEKAMMRLLNAIENPFTSILGHLTGRLLLSRNGYPIDHAKIIDACVANDVVIELNAHPRRLDIDWRWIERALKKGAMISINPDAHSIEGYSDCKYGVLVAQKAGLTANKNLSSYSLIEFERFLLEQHQKRS